MIFVSAAVLMAMSAMFVACSNTPVNGCTCTYSLGGETETVKYTLAEMKQYNYTKCSDIVDDFNQYGKGKLSCKGY